MARIDEIQTNFVAGELSPNLDSRTDFDPYFDGGSAVENFSVHPQGWLFRRKGMKLVNEVKDSTKKTRIIPFKYNIDQVLIIELGAGYFRFYYQQQLVLTGGGATYELANSFTENDLDYIRFIQKDDIIYITHPLNGLYKLSRLANNNWTLTTISLLYGPYQKENTVSVYQININGGGGVVGVNHVMTATGHSPFTSNHVGSLWLVRNNTDYAYVKIVAYISATQVTVQPQRTITNLSLYNGTNFSTWSAGEFGLHRSFPRALTFHEQRLVLGGSINETQKIWFSKSGDYENFDQDYNNLTVDDSFDRTVASNTNDSILWMYSDEVLFIGTSGGIWRAKPSNNGSGLSNTDIGLRKQIAFGATELEPVYADDSPFYLQTGKQKIRSIGFVGSKDKYGAEDVTIRSDHITSTGIKRFAYQQNPISTIYAVREDGQCACFVYESVQEVSAWSRIKTQGSIEDVAIIPSSSSYDEVYFVVNRTVNGVTKRFIEVLNPSFDYSNLGSFYVDCGLTYDGTKNTTLTIVGSVATSGTSTFTAGDVGKQIHNLNGDGRANITSYVSGTQVGISIERDFDSNSLSANGWAVAIKEVSGLSHLIGLSVQALGDGATDPDIKIVDSFGKITLSSFNSIIHAGLPYTSVWQSMPIEPKKLLNVSGSSQNKLGKITQLRIRFFKTRGGDALVDNKIITNSSRSSVDEMNKATGFYDNVIIDVSSDWTLATKFSIRQAEPQPMNIKSISYVCSINGV